MIMPCLNSASACDHGGSFAVVDAGSLFVGLPGAPGRTTTAAPGPVCCACAIGQKESVRALTPKNRPHNKANARADRDLPLRGQQHRHQFRTLLSIFGWS